MSETHTMRTEDGVRVKTGALIWYVNYLREVRPIIFRKKGKKTVKYFALQKNALEFANSKQKVR